MGHRRSESGLWHAPGQSLSLRPSLVEIRRAGPPNRASTAVCYGPPSCVRVTGHAGYVSNITRVVVAICGGGIRRIRTQALRILVLAPNELAEVRAHVEVTTLDPAVRAANGGIQTHAHEPWTIARVMEPADRSRE